MICLPFLLLLATPTIIDKFLLDRQRQSRKRNQNAVFTGSLSPTLLNYDSDFDS